MKHNDCSPPRPGTPLSSHLRWYGAAAGVFVAASTADAQVIYTDVDPDATVTQPSTDANAPEVVFPVDFDGDGDPEVLIAEFPVANYLAGLSEAGPGSLGPDAMNAVVGTAPDGYLYFLPLSAGQAISNGNVTAIAGFPYGPTFTFNDGDPAGWVGAGDQYAGVRFTLAPGGTTHFGWIRLSIPQNGVAVVRDYAYQSTPNTAIIAGDVGQTAVVLTGSVNQTTFPASGGTLVYAFTLTNGSGSSLPLRLRVVATRGGNEVLNRVLGSGTLPDGASVSQSVPLQVPANAPAGPYLVTYRFENTSTGAVVVSQAFTVTKAAAPGVSGDGPLFVATPPVGLFPADVLGAGPAASAVVEADVDEARVRGAAQAASEAALSVVGPNPFAGSTALALAVPSAQHVRVAVYDALGREVAVLHDGAVAAGEARRLTLDGSALAAGVYVVRSVGETFTEARTVTVTR